MNIKQLFCVHHVWRIEQEEFLYEEVNTMRALGNFLYKETTEVKALHLQCLKCGKRRIKQTKNLVSREYV